MDELVTVSMSFIPDVVEQFEQDFLETVESYLPEHNGYSPALQSQILNAVSRRPEIQCVIHRRIQNNHVGCGRFITILK